MQEQLPQPELAPATISPMPATRATAGSVTRSTALMLLFATLGLATLSGSAAAKYNPKKAIWGPTRVNGQSAFPIYKNLGVGIYSMALDWSRIAARKPVHPTDPNDPAYRWPGSVDGDVRAARRAGIHVNLEITYTPKWANGGRAKQWAATNPIEFGRFAAAAAKRYTAVHLWQIWGEPSRVKNFMPYDAANGSSKSLTPGQARGPQKYAQLVDAAYGALKPLPGRNMVIAGSTFTGGNIRTPLWIRYMKLPNGRPPRMDLYSHNPFSFREPNLKNGASRAYNVDFSDVARLDRTVSHYLAKPRGKKRLPLFLSEWCIPTGKDGEFNYQKTEAEQAKWINSAFKIVNRKDDPFIFALGWIHLQDGEGSMAGLIDSKGRKKPGYWAFRNG